MLSTRGCKSTILETYNLRLAINTIKRLLEPCEAWGRRQGPGISFEIETLRNILNKELFSMSPGAWHLV